MTVTKLLMTGKMRATTDGRRMLGGGMVDGMGR
jgi:hypothetical protein